MFAAVGHAIQTLTGRSLRDLYTSWLWHPLNMTTTFASIEDAQTCQKVQPDCKVSKHYIYSDLKQEYILRNPTTLPGATGPTGWITNMHDHAKWLRIQAHTSGPLSQESHKMIRSAFSISPNDLMSTTGVEWYGLGLTGKHDCATFPR